MMRNLALSTFLYLFAMIAVALYMFLIYLFAHNFWPHKATGSLMFDEYNNIRGSYLIAQHLKSKRYFKARPDRIFDNDCDVAIYNDNFKTELLKNYDLLDVAYDISMITSSSSSLDPYITKREALSQSSKVAKERGVDVGLIIELIDEMTIYQQAPFFELDIVNVNILNARLDKNNTNRSL